MCVVIFYYVFQEGFGVSYALMVYPPPPPPPPPSPLPHTHTHTKFNCCDKMIEHSQFCQLSIHCECILVCRTMIRREQRLHQLTVAWRCIKAQGCMESIIQQCEQTNGTRVCELIKCYPYLNMCVCACVRVCVCARARELCVCV